ncbi:regulatory protein RecX [Streptomyces celluloflavus]
MMTPVRMPAPQVPPSVTGSPDGGAGTRTPGQPACSPTLFLSPSSAPGSADTARSRASKAWGGAPPGAGAPPPPRALPEEAAEEVLSRFEDVGLIDDAAFADAWVESRHRGRGLARRALARELRTKGVDSGLIEVAVGRLDADQEESTARELVDRKLRTTRGLDREKRLRRLAGMLARKGYPEGLALRVVRRALEEEGEDPELLERHLPDD